MCEIFPPSIQYTHSLAPDMATNSPVLALNASMVRITHKKTSPFFPKFMIIAVSPSGLFGSIIRGQIITPSYTC